MLRAFVFPHSHHTRQFCLQIQNREGECVVEALSEQDKLEWIKCIAIASTPAVPVVDSRRYCGILGLTVREGTLFVVRVTVALDREKKVGGGLRFIKMQTTYKREKRRKRSPHDISCGSCRKKIQEEEAGSSALLKQKYKRLALQHHPDKGGTIDGFNAIVEAYAVLSSLNEEGSIQVGRKHAHSFDLPFFLFYVITTFSIGDRVPCNCEKRSYIWLGPQPEAGPRRRNFYQEHTEPYQDRG